MGFFKRIARGWRLMSYCFASIYREQPQLVKAAMLICVVPVVLFFIGALVLGQFTSLTNLFGLRTVELSQLRVPASLEYYKNILGALAGLSALTLIAGAFVTYIALFYILRAFLQGQQVSFKTALKAVLPRIPVLVLWIILDILGRRLAFHALPLIIYVVLYALWVWLSLWVIPVLALEKTSILNALRVSVTIALVTLSDIVGASLWTLIGVIVPATISIGLVVWLANQVNLLATTSAGLVFALFGFYLVAILVVVLVLANMLFEVALYLLTTEQPATQIPARIRMLYSEQLGPDQL